MVKRNPIPVITAAVLMVTISSGTAWAMSAYARAFKMQCNVCHNNPPVLNEFGTAFLRNGFVLPGQEGKKAPSTTRDANTAPPSPPAPSGGGDLPGTTTGSAGFTAPDGKEAPAQTAPPAEQPPRKVYHWPSPDGSVYYTDNDLRQAHVEDELKKQSPSKKPRKSGEIAVPKYKPERHKEKAPIPPGSYQECMERQLENHAQPASGQEMMDLLIQAEKSCYPNPRRH